MSYDAILGVNTIPEASGEMDGTSYNGLRAPGLGIPFGVFVPLALGNRIVTNAKLDGNTVLNFPSTYGYGEWAELRLTSNVSTSTFNGIFMRLQNLVANTQGITGLAMEVRGPSAGGNMGSMMGSTFEVDFKGTAAVTVGACYGVTGQISGDTGSQTTITAGAGLRAKLQTEAGMVLSGVSGLEITNEAISSIGLLGSAIKVQSTSTGLGFTTIIDALGTRLTVVDTDHVDLIKFKDSAGASKALRIKADGTVTVV